MLMINRGDTFWVWKLRVCVLHVYKQIEIQQITTLGTYENATLLYVHTLSGWMQKGRKFSHAN